MKKLTVKNYPELLELMQRYLFTPVDKSKNCTKFKFYYDSALVIDMSDIDSYNHSTLSVIISKIYQLGKINGQNQIKNRVNYLLNNDIWLP